VANAPKWDMQMTAIKSRAFGGQAGNFYDYFAFRTLTHALVI